MELKILIFVHLERHSLMDLLMRETLVPMDPCRRETMTLIPMDPRGRETETLILMDPCPGETISCVRMDPRGGKR